MTMLAPFNKPQMDSGDDRQHLAVKISNGFKIFKDDGLFSKKERVVTVLNGFNMNIPVGSLYSLLGSSGCGKTTVVSCVAGAKKLTSGQLEVFGNGNSYTTASDIGYMPQESCLYRYLSIYETLMYFGTLFGSSKEMDQKKYLIERIGTLRKLLSLPQDGRIVGTLSGGQQRRVSLAVALVHEPFLLILDEASFGVDPLIRERIWQHLKFLTATKGVTVLLTTHYVQEAIDSDLVGIMRNGLMIAEENPRTLMQTHGVNSLEALFFHLSKQQETSTLVPLQQSGAPRSPPPESAPGYFVTGCQNNTKRSKSIRNSVRRIGALVDKNFKSIFRNVWMMLFLVFDPAITMFVVSNTFRNEPHGISLGVVNNDIGKDAQCPNSTRDAFCRNEDLSCIFLDALPPQAFNLKSYGTIEFAREALMDGKIWGFMHFPENYTSALIDRALVPAERFEVEEDSRGYWNSSKIALQLDRTNAVIYSTILNTLYETLETSSMKILRDCGYDERLGEYSLQYKEPVVGAKGLTSLDYVAPSMIILVVNFFSLTVSMRLIDEKREGTLERSITGGATIWEIFMGYMISEFVILILQTALVLCVLHFGFSIIAHPSNVPLICVQCILQGLSGLAVGFFLAVICTAELEAAIAVIVIVLSNLILSGIVWPREGMPGILQAISTTFPMALPAEAMRSLMIRGWGIEHPNVWHGICIPVVYILGSTILAALLFGRNLRK